MEIMECEVPSTPGKKVCFSIRELRQLALALVTIYVAFGAIMLYQQKLQFQTVVAATQRCQHFVEVRQYKEGEVTPYIWYDGPFLTEKMAKMRADAILEYSQIGTDSTSVEVVSECSQ